LFHGEQGSIEWEFQISKVRHPAVAVMEEERRVRRPKPVVVHQKKDVVGFCEAVPR
jgi:hypothetical protein